MTIWKFPLNPQITDYEMPEGATLLTVQVQNEVPCLWALVNPKAPKEKRRIYIVGTGHEIDLRIGHYLGTFQVYGGRLVFHVFEEAVNVLDAHRLRVGGY